MQTTVDVENLKFVSVTPMKQFIKATFKMMWTCIDR